MNNLKNQEKAYRTAHKVERWIENNIDDLHKNMKSKLICESMRSKSIKQSKRKVMNKLESRVEQFNK